MCNKMYFVVLLCLTELSENHADPGTPSEPKYMMYFNTEVMVADDGKSKDFIDTSNVMVEWLNDTTASMNGVIKFLKPFEENTMVQVTLTKEVSGKNEIIVKHDICDICKEIGDKESQYYKYLRYIGFPDHCPFDAGEYLIDNYIMESTDYPLNSNTIGLYMATMDIYSNPSGDCAEDKIFLYSLQIGLTIEME